MTPGQETRSHETRSHETVRTVVELEKEWLGLEGVFGGRGIAALVEAARAVPLFDGLALASASVEFSGGLVPGDATIEVDAVHRGRSTAMAQVTCSQGRPLLRGVVRFVLPGTERLLAPHDLGPLPEPAEVAEFEPPYGHHPFADHFRVRIIDHTLVRGAPTTRAWVRMAPGSGLGSGGTVATLLDVLPPGLFFVTQPPAFVPTVDFTMHVDAAHAPTEEEWVLATMATEWATDTFCLETATLHHRDGRFIGRGTQNRRIVR